MTIESAAITTDKVHEITLKAVVKSMKEKVIRERRGGERG